MVSCGFVHMYGVLEEGISGVREQGSAAGKGPFLGCWNALCFIGVELTQCTMGTELTSHPMRMNGITRRATAEVTLK